MRRTYLNHNCKITDEGVLSLKLAEQVVSISRKLRNSGLKKETSRFYRFYRCAKTSVSELVPGDKVLLLRQYGGLGDIIIISYILNEFRKRFPGCQITFAAREGFHSLLQNKKQIAIFPYELVHHNGYVEDDGTMHSDITDRYDMVMDLTIPCHIWEEVMFDPTACKFRNRLDMWGNWIGMYDFTPSVKSSIEMDIATIARVRNRHIKPDGRPVAIIAPTPANPHKDYPFYYELAAALHKRGYQVVPVGEVRKMTKLKNVVHTANYRDFVALFYSADLVISVDSAAFHAGALAEAKTFGIFNTNDGETYCKYYPTATPIQVCEKRCIFRYCQPGNCINRKMHEIVMERLKENGIL